MAFPGLLNSLKGHEVNGSPDLQEEPKEKSAQWSKSALPWQGETHRGTKAPLPPPCTYPPWLCLGYSRTKLTGPLSPVMSVAPRSSSSQVMPLLPAIILTQLRPCPSYLHVLLLPNSRTPSTVHSGTRVHHQQNCSYLQPSLSLSSPSC